MNKDAPCYGQKFGHNFPYTGADCLKCGVNQAELSGGMKKATGIKSISDTIIRRPKPNPNLHSDVHWLVDELRKTFGETAKKGKGSFGFYLGFVKRIGFQKAYQLWSEVKQSNAKDKGRLFWWKVKQLGKPVDEPSQQKRNDNV